MAAAKIVLEPIFEADFLPTSYGFRPGLSAHHALETVRQTATWRGKGWLLDADIQSCFDEIDSHALLCQIERRVCDRQMLKLLRAWLRAGVFEGGIVSAIEAGTPQGSPISPLLANIALHTLDEAWAGGGRRLGTLVRYCDDFVVLCATREQAEQARELVAAVLDVVGLRLHRIRPGSRTSPEAPKGSTSSASTIGCGSRGSSEVGGTCTSGRPGGRWPPSRPRSVTGRTAGSQGCRWNTRSRTSTTWSVAGVTTSATETPRTSSAKSTATSANASRSSPAPSTGCRAATGSAASTTSGRPSSASIASAEQ